MIRINLLPFRAARKKENVRQQVSMFLLSLFLVLILLVWQHLNLGGEIEQLDAEVKETTAELTKFQKKNMEIAAIKRELRELNKKIGIIDTLEAGREGPVRLLDVMTDMVIPKRMWFTSLEEREVQKDPETKSQAVILNGVALDNKTVADFMKRLEGSNLFSSVDLITLRQEKGEKGFNLKAFQVNCLKAVEETEGTEEGEKKNG